MLALLRFELFALALINLRQPRIEFAPSPLIAVLSAALAFMLVLCLAVTWPVRHLKPFGKDNGRDRVCKEP